MGRKARNRRILAEAVAEHGPGLQTPALPIVGRTWKERGFPYYWRRFWYALMLLLILATVLAPTVAALIGIRAASHRGFWIVLTLAVITILLIGGLQWWQLGRRLSWQYSAASLRWITPAMVVVGLGFLFLPHGGWLALALIGVGLAGPFGAQFVRAATDRELWSERDLRLGGVSPSQRRWLMRLEHAPKKH